MNIKDTVQLTKTTPLIIKYEDKVYRFASTLEMAQSACDDYILIPLGSSDILGQVELHLSQNKYCKGFFIPKMRLEDDERFTRRYYEIVRKYSSQIEFIATERNLYNTIYNIARAKRRKYNYTVIAVSGAIGKSTVCSLLSKMLGDNVLSSTHNAERYQMAYEPLIYSNEYTKYCVCEIDHEKEGFSLGVSETLLPDAVAFTRITPNKTFAYESLGHLASDAAKILIKKPDAHVFTVEENEPFEMVLPSLEPSKFHLVSCGDIKTNFWDTRLYIDYFDEHYSTHINEFYMPQAIILSSSVARFFGRDQGSIQHGIDRFQKFDGVLKEVQLQNNSVAMFNTHHHSPQPFKYVLDHFCAKYPDKKKILVFSSVPMLGKLSHFNHKAMTLEMAGKDFSDIIWLDMDHFGDVLIKNNRKVFLKRFRLKPRDFAQNVPWDVKKYIESLTDYNSAVLYTVHPNFKISKIYEEAGN